MAAIIGAILMLIVIILSILLIFGLPLGELTMGGRYKVFPKKLRIMLVSQLVTQVFLCIIILQTGGYLPLWFPFTGTRIICIAAAAYLSLNTVMNLISTSRKEKLIMRRCPYWQRSVFGRQHCKYKEAIDVKSQLLSFFC